MRDWSLLKKEVEGNLPEKPDEGGVDEAEEISSEVLSPGLQEPGEKRLNELVINKTDVKILHFLLPRESITLKELREKINRSRVSIYHSLKKLEEHGFITKSDSWIENNNTRTLQLLDRLRLNDFDLEHLTGKRLKVLQFLTSWRKPDQISRGLDISTSSAYKYLNQLAPLLEKDKDKGYRIKEGQKDLQEFIQHTLRKERQAKKYALIWSSGDEKLVKTISKDAEMDGTLTAFSRFPEFRVKYDPGSNYYLIPPRKVSVEEIFVHSLKSIENTEQLTHALSFYLKNRGKIKHLKVEKHADKYGVIGLWLDVQAYLHKKKSSSEHRDLFPPRRVLREKLNLKLNEKPLSNVEFEDIQNKIESPEAQFLSNLASRQTHDVLECERLLQEEEIDWDSVRDILFEKMNEENGQRFMEPVTMRLNALNERLEGEIPLNRELTRKLMEEKITEYVEGEKRTIKEIQQHLGVPEYQIRNLLNKLNKELKVKKLNTEPLRFTNYVDLE